jgi:hypothetical protein
MASRPLDAAGRVLWATAYTFGAPGTYAASGQLGVRLSDDGGVVASALVSDPADPLGGRLWAFKPFAKDGTIDFLPGAATASSLAVANLPCFMTASDIDVPLTPIPMTSRRVPATSTPVTLDVAQQTEN